MVRAARARKRRTAPAADSPAARDRVFDALQVARVYAWERELATQKVLRFGDPLDVLGVDPATLEEFVAIVHEDDRERVREAISGAIDHGRPYELEFRVSKPNGEEAWVRDVGRCVSDRFLGVSMDVTRELRARLAVERLAYYDSLTGLPNRALMRQRLDDYLHALEPGQQIAVLWIDLDNFKNVNDLYGHQSGDLLLQQVGAFLKTLEQGHDLAGRFAGDEFILVLDPGNPATVQATADSLHERARAPFHVDGQEVYVGFSIGAAFASERDESTDTLLQAADTALYQAKTGGSGNLCIFEAAMDAQARRRRALQHKMAGAIAQGEFSLHYQPLVDLARETVDGFEALARWHCPDGEPISPAEFIPIAESSGLITRLGEWVLRAACREAAGWARGRVSVNVSAIQFRHRGFVPSLIHILAETGLQPERLNLEVTESVLLGDTEGALAVFGQLKQLGVSIALDDFGTGFSSFAYLFRFPFDGLKIDKSFVQNIGRTPKAAVIIRAILSVGHDLGMRVTAEGVETPEQLGVLIEEGCDLAQGFLIARPAPADTVAAFLSPGYAPAGSLARERNRRKR